MPYSAPYTARSPTDISMNTCTNSVKIEHMLVHTTSCPASCWSLSISAAMIALDTATGVPKRATSAGYSVCPKLKRSVNSLRSTAQPTPIKGAMTMRKSVPTTISPDIPEAAENSN